VTEIVLLALVLAVVVLHLAWDAGWLSGIRRWWKFQLRPGTRARKRWRRMRRR
jgi:hypothetical protein